MSGHLVKACRSCVKPVIWTVTESNWKRMPVDAEPSDVGEFRLLARADEPEPWARWIMPLDRYAYSGELHTSHFANCPHAQKWRKKKARA